ncbi:3040_t:CDS:2, partial [Entrophospora sp. SA101]
ISELLDSGVFTLNGKLKGVCPDENLVKGIFLFNNIITLTLTSSSILLFIKAFNKLFHDFDSGILITDTAARNASNGISLVFSDDNKKV